jgi:apolipoprotein N-acyltransferase
VVDPEGVVTQQTSLYEEAIVRADLPLVAAPTPYLRLRTVIDVVIAVAGAAVLAMLLLDRRHRREPETTPQLSAEEPPVPTTSS